MFDLLLASNNSGKLLEMQTLLVDLPLKAVSPSEINLMLNIPETGGTYAENAALKAKGFAARSNLICLADDTGLEVEVLGGFPGLHSARILQKEDGTDAERRAFLLACLRNKPRPWKARFVCVVALAEMNGIIHYSEGECHGEIITEERGIHGFGYDALFYFPHLGCTMAELSLEQKNQISHRAKAIKGMKQTMVQLIASQKS